MLDYRNPNLKLGSRDIEPGEVSWRSPSNIALIKYWGKMGQQHPRNPSISFTLNQAVTDMRMSWETKTSVGNEIELDFAFHGEPNDLFRSKIIQYLHSIQDRMPFLTQVALKIETGNSFPHSSGIASSAASMSALALCLCSLEDELFQTLQEDDSFERKASYLARLASGSACRSIYGKAALWGQYAPVSGSSDDYAIPMEDQFHETFKTYHDDILLVSAEEKKVSSRAGHALMDEHPFASARYEQANKNMAAMLAALKSGDTERFGQILELEAWTLHSLMMSSADPFSLILPNTLTILEKVKQYRADTGHPLYFTLDAGPNVHLLYPDSIFIEVTQFVEDQLLPHCADGQYIQDEVGEGPEEV
ncbi:MAG: diphosphomevalonate decarboxylase [Saprospiraceae bacterium]